MKGRLVITKRSGPGYMYDYENTGAQRTRVHIIDHNFDLTGKVVRCFDRTLHTFAKISKEE